MRIKKKKCTFALMMNVKMINDNSVQKQTKKQEKKRKGDIIAIIIRQGHNLISENRRNKKKNKIKEKKGKKKGCLVLSQHDLYLPHSRCCC